MFDIDRSSMRMKFSLESCRPFSILMAMFPKAAFYFTMKANICVPLTGLTVIYAFS